MQELVPGSKIEPEKPSKEEYAVAKWLRSNVPNKKTKFLNYSVEYFTGLFNEHLLDHLLLLSVTNRSFLSAVKAVDALMESHWAKEGKSGEEPMFTCREDVVDFLERYAPTHI